MLYSIYKSYNNKLMLHKNLFCKCALRELYTINQKVRIILSLLMRWNFVLKDINFINLINQYHQAYHSTKTPKN